MITPDAVEYAILSHTWGDEEITFQDLTVESNLEIASLADHVYALAGQLSTWGLQQKSLKQRKGYKKVKTCCAIALAHGYEWAWVDTVCIDKKSSAELSEAINSMYNWYAKSKICFAYMSDVSMTGEDPDAPITDHFPMTAEDLDTSVIDRFKSSRWFRRGWTLQELLAPPNIIFFDRDWRRLGDRSRLAGHISSTTGINRHCLRPGIAFNDASIAKRMSWASHRSTTRLEDEAYCLLGLFQINMALLYGEGSRAFTRLQYEIIRNSDDESIFAWYTDEVYSGMFAKRPSAFAGCGDFFPYREPLFPRAPYTMTNRGLSLDAVCKLSSKKCDDKLGTIPMSDCILIPLNCSSRKLRRPFTIIVVHHKFQNINMRYFADELVNFDTYCKSVFDSTERKTLYISGPGLDEKQPDSWYNNYSKYRHLFGGKSNDCLITLDRHSLQVLDIHEWFITPPGDTISPGYVEKDWTIRLSGRSGFAVLTFTALRAFGPTPLWISITYGHTPEFQAAFDLHFGEFSDAKIPPDFIQACFDQFEVRKSSLKVRPAYSLPMGEGRIITLKRQFSGDEQCSYILGARSSCR
ncbi:MAG: hypothetical protein Q9169_008035 [Polycauliona sp. 2 TL-2023]